VAVKRKTILSLILSLFLYLPAVAWASGFGNIVVFGDSLSDNGNFYALYPSWIPLEYYYQGRFSNGPVWVEYLTDEDFLDCNLVDNAYGGATTDGITPPGLISQVSTYIGSTTVEDNTLFIIWIGANDFLNGSVDYQSSANSIGLALDDLAMFGAEDILIINLPDLGATPRYLGTQSETAFRALSNTFNETLADLIDAFQTDNPEITVYEFDSYSFLQDIANNPGIYGFTNATQVCPSFYLVDNFDNSDGYVFWNSIHPTTETHEELAKQVMSILPDSSNDGGDGHSSCFIGTVLSTD
jgi:phospholipase/lecithinase/hemolysin